MFTQREDKLGLYKLITVESISGVSFSIIPEMGARLNNYIIPLQDGCLDIVEGYTSEKQLTEEYYSKSSLLAPFPNRIANGKYKFGGEQHQLEINKPDEENAIHGFISDKPFSIVRSGVKEDKYELVMEYSSGKVKGYPFSFIISVIYIFSIDGTLSVQTELKNTGETSMPVGFGWHPYFTLKSNINDLKLRLPKVSQFEVDQRLIPTGGVTEVLTWIEPRKIEETSFDTGFQFITEDKTVSLINSDKGIAIQVDCGEAYEFVQIFTPPWRTSIAIEPMTCAVNAFNNGVGLNILKPQESLSADFSISILRS